MSRVRVAAQRFLHDLFSDCRFDNVSRSKREICFVILILSLSRVQFRQICRQVHVLTEADEDQEDQNDM